MLLLGGLLNELKGLHDQGKSGHEVTSNTSTLHVVADTHPLHDLFKTVEGVSKFIGPLESSNRRTLLHSGPLTELDGSSGSAQNNVLLYLLSDLLLLAVKKRKGLKIKYVAEKVFYFNQLSAVDVRDVRLSPDGTVFKLVDSGIRPFFFKVDSVQAKRIWLQMIKLQLDIAHSASTNPANFEIPTSSSPSKEVRISQNSRGDLSIESKTRLSEQLEELDLFISLQDYDSAFHLVNQLSSHPELPSRISKLTQSLLRTLGHRPASVITLQRLIFLNQLDAARSTYLQGRTQLLKDAIRKIKFQGDIPRYLHDLSYLTTSCIQITCEQFHEAFHEFPQVYSFLTEWCTEQIHLLAKSLLKQIGGDPSLKSFTECLSVIETNIANLKHIGFNLEFSFWNTLIPHLTRSVEALEQTYTETLLKFILEDSFEPVENPFRQGISDSVVQFCNIMKVFLDETQYLHAFLMCHPFLEAAIHKLFESFCNRQSQALRERNFSEPQQAVLQVNLLFLSTEYDLKLPWQFPNSVLHQAFHETLPVPIAVGTLTQLVLDLHFLLKKAPNLSTEATTLAQGLCERVFKLYLQNGGQPSSLKDGR
ncbi:exocyst complex component exo84, partial [Coelomomyces lativittatus]